MTNMSNQLEEKLSKRRCKELFDLDKIKDFEVGTFKGLTNIHHYLFQDVYLFAGKIRDVNISKDSFRFASFKYLDVTLKKIDKMPMNTFEDIIEKYVEMNIAHPFQDGNGRATRLWLDLMLKNSINMVIDWNLVTKSDYFLAMTRSPIKDIEIKYFLRKALTDDINSRKIFMQGIDISFYFEGFNNYLIEELG